MAWIFPRSPFRHKNDYVENNKKMRYLNSRLIQNLPFY